MFSRMAHLRETFVSDFNQPRKININNVLLKLFQNKPKLFSVHEISTDEPGEVLKLCKANICSPSMLSLLLMQRQQSK